MHCRRSLRGLLGGICACAKCHKTPMTVSRSPESNPLRQGSQRREWQSLTFSTLRRKGRNYKRDTLFFEHLFKKCFQTLKTSSSPFSPSLNKSMDSPIGGFCEHSRNDLLTLRIRKPTRQAADPLPPKLVSRKPAAILY